MSGAIIAFTSKKPFPEPIIQGMVFRPETISSVPFARRAFLGSFPAILPLKK